MMTPGPASAMVTLLPRKRPTPIAPPMAIMVSWRELRRRWRSASAAGAAAMDCFRSAIVESSVRDVFQHVSKPVHFFFVVVVDQRGSDRSDVGSNAHPAKQARGV